MTNAEKALEIMELIEALPFTPKYKDVPDTIRAALKLKAAVDGDGLLIPYDQNEHTLEWTRSNNDLLERLRGIK